MGAAGCHQEPGTGVAVLSLPPPRTVVLAGEADFAGFRTAARGLLAAGATPDTVLWLTADGAGTGQLFADAAPTATAPPPTDPRTAVPQAFVTLCQSVVLHDDPQRFALMYRLLWRLVHEPAVRHDPLDADMMQARQMYKAVRRDMHKMKAFVRFRTLDDGHSQPLHVAWFEPSHHIVEAVAPFFARRFTAMRWAILTPRRCVRWTPPGATPEGALHFSPGAQRSDAPPADAGEALWLTYYTSIFNPARLKMAMMQKEMPRKYWRNLPEAQLIAPLAAQSAQRTGRMVEQPATTPARTVRLLPRAAPAVAQDMHAPIDSVDALRAATARCRSCPIGQHATQAVCGEGPMQPALMFVGEQPGDQEDLQGRPFVGPAGQLLDRALHKLGIARDTVYVANAVKHFKYELQDGLRGKRRIHKTASQHEAAACQHWLEDEIRLVQPRALVALGATAARALMGYDVAVTRERGQWLQRADGLAVLVTLHPSALLRAAPAEQAQAKQAWLADLKRALVPPT